MFYVMTKSIQINLIIMLFFLVSISNVAIADTIYLKNSEILTGNIIENNNKQVTLDVVIDSELIGGKISIAKDEIKLVQKDNKYIHLVRSGIPEQEKESHLIQYRERTKVDSDVNEWILRRVKKEADRIKEIEAKQEDKRRFEKQLQHEKEMEILKAKLQKELIEASKNSGVNPDVHLINGY